MSFYEPWMDAVLDLVDPFDGSTAEETRRLLVRALEAGPDNTPEDVLDQLTDGDIGDVIRRMVKFGMALGRIAQEHVHQPAPEDGDVTPPIPGHPDLTAMLDRIEVRVPDVRPLHAYAQAALLSAIRRLADDATDAADVHTLADAYMSLPTPTEDGFVEDE